MHDLIWKLCVTIDINNGSWEGEALRDDANFTFVSAWEFTGTPSEANLHKEELEYKNIELKQRSYK